MADETPTDETPAPRRKAQDKMGVQQKAELRSLCLRPDCQKPNGAGPNIPAIMKLTGYSYAKIQSFISKDKFLNAAQAEANANKLLPVEAELINGETPPRMAEAVGERFTREQWAEYKALKNQNRKISAEEWASLGMTEDDGKRMEHYCQLGRAPLGSLLSALTGQLLSNVTVLDRVLKGDAERILAQNLPVEDDGKKVPRDSGAVQRDWRASLYHGMDLQLRMTFYVHKMVAMMAKVGKEMKAANGDSPQPKGTYTPRGA